MLALPLTLVTVAEKLSAVKQMDENRRPAYLAELWDKAPCAAQYGQYAEIIHEKSVRREFIEAIRVSHEQAGDLGEE